MSLIDILSHPTVFGYAHRFPGLSCASTLSCMYSCRPRSTSSSKGERMQTFLPYASFEETAVTLDRQRLGKRRALCWLNELFWQEQTEFFGNLPPVPGASVDFAMQQQDDIAEIRGQAVPARALFGVFHVLV